jgi:site-specific DNA-methyltransferase (adenine-specific)
MIIPARWYAGGMGLSGFREEMLNDKHIRSIVDYPNSKDCFSGIELRGGVCYFLWDKDYEGECEYRNITNLFESVMNRNLNEFPVFIRYNQALQIISRIRKRKEKSLSGIISTVSPFGINTAIRGMVDRFTGSLTLYSSGGAGYIAANEILQGKELIDKYKVLISNTISGNLEEPPFKIIAILQVLRPKEICTFSYLIGGSYDNEIEAKNLKLYLETKFCRFLLLQAISSIHISKDKFVFVPMQDFSEPWTDEKLYKKYGLTKDEIAFIESMIRPMESEGE